MTNYLNETDDKYCLILILNVRSDIWFCREYGIPKPKPCPMNQFIVVCVHSATEHQSRRQVVRSTWGNVTRWSVILLCPRPIEWGFIQ